MEVNFASFVDFDGKLKGCCFVDMLGLLGAVVDLA